jgi:glycine dehydrogenase
VQDTIPQKIRLTEPLPLDPPLSESDALTKLKNIMSKNVVNRSFIGMGYYETVTPPVILRNMLENPGWYTSYTPYQAEISQGRLQGLLNFQTMVADLTAMSLCNASLLDEATAASEAMTMAHAIANKETKNKFFIDEVSLVVDILIPLTHFFLLELPSPEHRRHANEGSLSRNRARHRLCEVCRFH